MMMLRKAIAMAAVASLHLLAPTGASARGGFGGGGFHGDGFHGGGGWHGGGWAGAGLRLDLASTSALLGHTATGVTHTAIPRVTQGPDLLNPLLAGAVNVAGLGRGRKNEYR